MVGYPDLWCAIVIATSLPAPLCRVASIKAIHDEVRLVAWAQAASAWHAGIAWRVPFRPHAASTGWVPSSAIARVDGEVYARVPRLRVSAGTLELPQLPPIDPSTGDMWIGEHRHQQ